MLQSTIFRSSLSNDGKTNRLKTFFIGAAKTSIQGLGYSSSMLNAASISLERMFGHHHTHLSAQQWYPTMKNQDSKSLVEFADNLSNFVGILQAFSYSNDLCSSSILQIVTVKLLFDTKHKWFRSIGKPQNTSKQPNLRDLKTWLQELAVVQERLLSSMKTSKLDPGEPNGYSRERDPSDRSSNFEAVVSGKKSISQWPLQDSVHRNWQCEVFKKKSIDYRYRLVRERKLCFSCLNGSHEIKDGRTRKCGIDGC